MDGGARPRLLFVSAGLSPRGGGIAMAGRLQLAATREWVKRRGSSLRLLTLGEPADVPPGVEGAAFAGNRAALARAVWKAQLLDGYRRHVYDFLGVARIQGVLPRRLRARYLVYVYGIECWRPLHGSRRRALDGAAVRLACSSYTVQRLRQANPDAPAVVPLHLALGDEVPTAGADAALLAGLGDRVVLIVGRLAPGERYKGHQELIAAVARLHGVQLVVVGEGEDRDRLAALAAALGIGDRVRFTGFVEGPTLAALYRRCALFAMPSDGEGFGFVYLEAMRAGKPCIALADSAAAEIIVDGETGRLVERGVEPLAAALVELLDDPARAAAWGAAGRARWERHFRADAFHARFAARLDALAGWAPESGSMEAESGALAAARAR
ncbi:MAG TPA: glycosyltransferase family 4 protein [Thermoanaerobaculia bacterium]|jgi:phosphatidylinositol alpha-1,6-mannosyltransferase|nr:glycosyltransferase family 4 protein [Thermoanaerobaculia bacterium]